MAASPLRCCVCALLVSSLSGSRIFHFKATHGLNSFVENEALIDNRSSGSAPQSKGAIAVPVEVALAKGGKGALAASAQVQADSPLGKLHKACEDHEELEREFPLPRYEHADVRGKFDGSTVVIGDVEVQGLDIPIAVDVTSSNAGVGSDWAIEHGISAHLHTKPGKSCKQSAESVGNVAACISLHLRDIDFRTEDMLTSAIVSDHYDEMNLLVSLSFDMTLTLKPDSDEEKLNQELQVHSFNLHVEDLVGFGGPGITNTTLQTLINTGLVQRVVTNMIAASGEHSYNLLPFQRQLLNLAILKEASATVALQHTLCEGQEAGRSQGTDYRLCLSYDITLHSVVKSGLLNDARSYDIIKSIVDSTDMELSDEKVRKAASFIEPICSGIDSVEGSMDFGVTAVPFAWNAKTTWDAHLNIEDILHLFGINIAETDDRIQQFLDQHDSTDGWLRFAFNVGKKERAVGILLAAIRNPYVTLDAALSIDFVQMTNRQSAWKMQLHGSASRTDPFTVRVGAEDLQCSYNDGMHWELCKMLGNQASAQVTLRGSILLTQKGDIVACLSSPCAEGLVPLELSLSFSSPSVPTIRISPDHTISLTVKVSKVLKPLGQDVLNVLLRESENGPPKVVVNKEMKEAVAESVENMQCSWFSGIGRGMINKKALEIDWEPGLAKKGVDANRIKDLLKKPEVQGKNKFYKRNNKPGKLGEVDVVSFGHVGLAGDIMVRGWQPDLRPNSEDMKWLKQVNFNSPEQIESVMWILELGGASKGTATLVEVIIEDFFSSDSGLDGLLSHGKVCSDGKCKVGVKAALSMRLVVLKSGEIEGCLGKCCKSSVHVDKVKIKNFGNNRVRIVNSLLQSVVGAVGNFIPELIGNFLPNLLEIPLKAAMAHLTTSSSEYSAPLAGVPPGSHEPSTFSFRFTLGHNMEQDELHVLAKPAVDMSILDHAVKFQAGPGLEHLGSLSVDANKLVHITPPEKVKAKIDGALTLGLKRCQMNGDDCSYSSVIPLSFGADPKTAKVHVKLDGLETNGNIEALMVLISQFLAQPPGGAQQQPNAKTVRPSQTPTTPKAPSQSLKDFCLSGLDYDDALLKTAPRVKRNHDMFPPLSRDPVFEEPLRSLKNNIGFASKVTANIRKTHDGQEHEATFGVKGNLRVDNRKVLMRPWTNDAGIADFGYVFFRSSGFQREVEGILSTASSNVDEVTVRCGSLIMDGEVKIDLTDPDVTLQKADKCLVISRPATTWENLRLNGVADKKTYTICANTAKLQSLHAALQTELLRQQAFRHAVSAFETREEDYTCKLPVSSIAVLAQPPKSHAFNWHSSSPSQSSNPTLALCLSRCGDHPPCAGVALRQNTESLREPCRFFGLEEIERGGLKDTPGMFTKDWHTNRPSSLAAHWG